MKLKLSKPWIIIGTLLVVGACGIWLLLKVVFGSFVMADCTWTGNATAWIDENRNGIKDDGEPPLSDVQFFVDDTDNKYTDVGGDSITNWKGESRLSVWLPGCPKTKMEVYPQIPLGYELTTSPRLKGGKSDETYEFGFAYLPGVPTATPLPPAPVCKSYKVGLADKNELTDLAISPDGTVWVSVFDVGVSKFAPESDGWVKYTTSEGLVDNHVDSITIAGNDAVWFATRGGASRFDGSTWQSFTMADGLVNDIVWKIAVGNNNLVWFATSEGASVYDPNARTWRSFTENDGLTDKYLNFVATAPDGSVWFSTLSMRIIKLDWSDYPNGAPQWQTYSRWPSLDKGSVSAPISAIDDIDFQSDLSIWFTGLDGVAHFLPDSSNWVLYNESTSNGAFRGFVHSLAIAKDGSVWIGGGNTEPIIFHLIPKTSDTGTDIWRSYDKRDGIPSVGGREDGVLAIAIAPDGSIWIGTQEHATHCVFSGQ